MMLNTIAVFVTSLGLLSGPLLTGSVKIKGC